MKKYLYDYIDELEKNMKKRSNKDLHCLKEDIIIKIGFFQQERIVHLIITLFYAMMFLIFLVLISLSLLFIIPAFILMIFLICYVIHYFRLENGVQYLYKLYDEINISINKSTKSDKK